MTLFKNQTYSPLKKESFFYKHRFVFISFFVSAFLLHLPSHVLKQEYLPFSLSAHWAKAAQEEKLI